MTALPATLLASLALYTATNTDSEVRATVFDSQGDRVPLHTVVPEYPRKLRRDRIEGEVQVCFEVDRDGRTRRVAVRRSTHRALEKPALKAVRGSTFQALQENEVLSGIKSCRTFVFALKPVAAD